MRIHRAGTNGGRASEGRQVFSRATLARTLLLLVGLIPLLLASCSTDSVSATSPAKDQTFTWPFVGAKKISYAQILDPALIYRLDDLPTAQMIFTSLVTLDKDLKVAPDAATSWDVAQSGVEYTFHLRPNMKFSDGQPLTAKDFAYSIDRALDPRLCPVYDAQTYGPQGPQGEGIAGSCDNIAATYLTAILGATDKLGTKGDNIPSLISQGDDPKKGLNVIDPLTLKIRLNAPVSYFLQALTYPTSFALEQSFVENPQWAGGKWVDHLDQGGCSGPFKVQSYGDGTQMTLVPNPAWQDAWDKHIQIQQVQRPVVYDQDQAYSDYRAGKYDYVVVPSTSYNTARGQGDFHEVPTLSTVFASLNWAKAPFDNLQVRQAFALSLNKQILVDRIEQGAGAPSNHFVPRGMPGYDVNLKNPPPDGTQSLTGNQTAATNLLKKAQDSCPASGNFFDKRYAYCRYIVSVDGKPLQDITFYYRQGKVAQAALAIGAADQWKNSLGLSVKAVGLDDSIFFGQNVALPAAEDPMQGWFLGWIADYPDPQDWLSLFFRTDAGYNWTGVSDPEIDQLLDGADKELNFDKRMGMYNQVEQWAVDNGGMIPISQEKYSWRQRPWVSGFALTPLQSMIDVNWPNVVILTH
ncbi:MAG TPA: peptide ABC transporter substrate-binding protein [Ktedonobacterales bacterium]|nr:peptide ABC transporter substrate-binding protein [Ktedonobacterales bacterium]